MIETINLTRAARRRGLIEDDGLTMVELLEDSGYDVTENIAVVTARPSLSPVLAPTSSIPTIAPSITGFVATIDVSKVV